MADNTIINPGAGGDTVATDDVGGVKFQRVKVNFGADGEALDVSAANPLPIVIAVMPTTPVTGAFFQATQPISGTVALDAPSLAALETISVANFPALQAVSIGQTVNVNNGQVQPITDAQLRASALLVSGNFYQAVQPTTDSSDVEYTAVPLLVTAAGDTTAYTPAAGKRIRLRWVYAINDPSAATPARVTIRLGADVKYIAYGISKKQVDTGPIDGALIVNLSQAGNVACTFRIEEI